jgi:hypothetical protein
VNERLAQKTRLLAARTGIIWKNKPPAVRLVCLAKECTPPAIACHGALRILCLEAGLHMKRWQSEAPGRAVTWRRWTFLLFLYELGLHPLHSLVFIFPSDSQHSITITTTTITSLRWFLSEPFSHIVLA